jgi:hypothetical protein
MLLHRPTALLPLPLPRKWCCRFLSPLKINRPRPSLNPRILGPTASMLTTKPSKATRLTPLESLLLLDSKSKTFLWLWWLVAALSPRKLGFAPRTVQMGFVVDKVELGQVSHRVLLLYPVSIIPPWLSVLVRNLADEQ